MPPQEACRAFPHQRELRPIVPLCSLRPGRGRCERPHVRHRLGDGPDSRSRWFKEDGELSLAQLSLSPVRRSTSADPPFGGTLPAYLAAYDDDVSFPASGDAQAYALLRAAALRPPAGIDCTNVVWPAVLSRAVSGALWSASRGVWHAGHQLLAGPLEEPGSRNLIQVWRSRRSTPHPDADLRAERRADQQLGQGRARCFASLGLPAIARERLHLRHRPHGGVPHTKRSLHRAVGGGPGSVMWRAALALVLGKRY